MSTNYNVQLKDPENTDNFWFPITLKGNVTDLTDFVGATSSAAGANGLVPAPSAGDQTKFLRGDGSWQDAGGGGGSYTLPHATSSALGGIKIGYTETGNNYAVVLDSNDKAYVSVPWYNTTYTLSQDATDGHKITLTPSSGSATTITIPDNNTWKANSSSSEGYVTSSSGQANKVWKTDSNGNPDWRDDTNTEYSAGTGLSLNGTTFDHSNSITAGSASEGGSARTLAFGGTFNVPTINYDAQGHITSLGTATILTLPSYEQLSNNTSGSIASTNLKYSSNILIGRYSTGDAILGGKEYVKVGTSANNVHINGVPSKPITIYDSSIAVENRIITSNGLVVAPTNNDNGKYLKWTTSNGFEWGTPSGGGSLPNIGQGLSLTNNTLYVNLPVSSSATPGTASDLGGIKTVGGPASYSSFPTVASSGTYYPIQIDNTGVAMVKIPAGGGGGGVTSIGVTGSDGLRTVISGTSGITAITGSGNISILPSTASEQGALITTVEMVPEEVYINDKNVIAIPISYSDGSTNSDVYQSEDGVYPDSPESQEFTGHYVNVYDIVNGIIKNPSLVELLREAIREKQ